ncbi:lipocalin family protein [Salinimicrobium flavum]|uniref:Lipocalin family protein n=1 Tax=Salinimicrobium flavum TaxID=1737065 RepID=A0ABW5IXA8_9FLAO
MKTLITLLFLLVAINSNAQSTDLIVGDWIFKKALNENIDEAGLAQIKAEVIDKWKFVFKPNGEFETYIMDEKGTGKWKLTSDSKSIVLTGMEESPMELKILSSTENELVLKLGLGEFLLKKIDN